MKSELRQRYKKFASLLVEARKTAGLSQQEVADKIGRSQAYVSKIERGARKMDIMEFLELAEALKFNPATLLRKLNQNKP
jgi:transcriptional regulator with XRE-family HTH domain